MDYSTKEYKITPKQDKYAYYLAKGFSQRQAYYKAYPNSKSWTERTVDNKASKALKNEKVTKAFKKYSDEFRVSEENNVAERTLILDEDVFEAVVNLSADYSDIKEYVQEAILKSLPSNYEDMDEWLKDNKRRNIKKSVRYEVLSRANFRCEACGDSPKVNNECVLHVDHIVPRTMGGLENITNYQCLCERCNISKSNRYAINNHLEYTNI